MNLYRPITALAIGHPGTGKSTFAASGPAPRLILDPEMRAHHLRLEGTRVLWNPMMEEPPEADNTIVQVKDNATMQRVYEWLDSGAHKFRHVDLDSLMEWQVNYVRELSKGGGMKIQEWGDVLNTGHQLCARLRDMAADPNNSIVSVVVTCGSKADDSASVALQGQLRDKVAYLFDMVGHFIVGTDAEGSLTYQAVVAPVNGFGGKMNIPDLADKYGMTIVSPNMSTLLTDINPEVS